MARNWVEWHQAYERPDSSLTARLGVVTGLLRDAFDHAPPGRFRCLSLCAGDARDLTGALDDHPRAADVVGAVVELDAQLADRARRGLRGVAPGLDVRTDDAGAVATFADVVPVDVLVLVGIFGNITDDDISTTIRSIPQLCRDGATIVWTRHRRDPDATPMIRAAFDQVGCSSVAFESPGAGSFAIGVERFHADRRPDGRAGEQTEPLPASLFSFRDDLW